MERDAEADRHAVEAAARDCGVVIDQHTDAKTLRAALDAASPDGVFGDDRLPKRIERIDATKKCDGVEKVEKVVEKVAGRRIDRIDVACGDAVATAKTAARRAARRKRRALEDCERLLDASRRASRSQTTWDSAPSSIGGATRRRGGCWRDGGGGASPRRRAGGSRRARCVWRRARRRRAPPWKRARRSRTKTKTTARGSGARASDAADDERTVRVRVEVAVEAKTTTTTAREDAGANEPDGREAGGRAEGGVGRLRADEGG